MEPEQLLKILQQLKVLTFEEVDSYLIEIQAVGIDAYELLEEKKGIDKKQLAQYLADYYGMELIDLEQITFTNDIIESIDAITAQQYRILPVGINSFSVRIAVVTPLDMRDYDDLRILLGKDIEMCLAVDTQIDEFITKYYGASMETIDDILGELGDEEVEMAAGEEDNVEEVTAQAESAPIIKLVNMLIIQAINSDTSDIHIEPMEREVVVRYRIDGILRVCPQIPKKLQGAVLARLKIMSKMNIAERRIPQDGRIKIKNRGKEIDFRVSALPCIHGESFVLRILDKSSVSLGLEQVGFLEDNKKIFDELIRKPNGIILVTGPTGSGKTTTLYSALNEINTPDRKLITIEDPVEYQLDGINQMQVSHGIGLDFAAGLRSILRQSPDVVLVGEIRDKETAEIAIRAALTGHLVFSTLHTNDAPGAITRLIDMEVSPFLVASSLQAVMAQRLVRTICKNCKEEYDPGEKLIKELGFPIEEVKNTKFMHGAGCEICNYSGYKGRTAIFELMLLTEELKELIIENATVHKIRELALKSGMRTLRQDGFLKVKLGMTTLLEIARITASDKDEENAESAG